jgi:hypothetical protein
VKKHPFILLEVMIALSLAIICAIPLVLRPIQMFRSEISFLEEGEGERLADWTFSEIKEKLLTHEIGWDKLPKINHKSGPYTLPPQTIQLPGKTPKKIKRSFTVFCKGEKEGQDGKKYRIFYITVLFEPKLSLRKKEHYVYRMVYTETT